MAKVQDDIIDRETNIKITVNDYKEKLDDLMKKSIQQTGESTKTLE